MITALAIAAIVLTALLALSLPWFGWGPGIDAAGRGMAIFFPAILMGLRVSCLAVAAIVLAAAGGFAWSGLHPVLSGLLAVLLVAGMGATSFFSVERLINAPRAGGRAGAAFLATIAAPMILVLWLLVERHGAGDPAQAWALRALVLAAALAPLPMLIRNERQRIAERRTQDADEARQEAEAEARAAALPAGASFAATLAFADSLDEDDRRARERVMARAAAFPDPGAALLAMLGDADRETRLRAALHASAFPPAPTPAYFALVRPLIEEVVTRLAGDAAPPEALYREALAAIRAGWPAMHNDGLPKALMDRLAEAIAAKGETAGFNALAFDARLLADYVAA